MLNKDNTNDDFSRACVFEVRDVDGAPVTGHTPNAKTVEVDAEHLTSGRRVLPASLLSTDGVSAPNILRQHLHNHFCHIIRRFVETAHATNLDESLQLGERRVRDGDGNRGRAKCACDPRRRRGGRYRVIERDIGFDVENGCTIDEINTAEIQHMIVNGDDPRQRLTDGIRPMRTTRAEYADFGLSLVLGCENFYSAISRRGRLA